jgi:hypothetical protein
MGKRSLRTLLLLAGATCVAAPTLLVRAASPFGSEPVPSRQVIALAQPLGDGRWNLVVLEQREPAPPCWRRHADGTVTSYETHLSEATCGRYLSSNAYSLRVAGNDLRHPWRLRIEQQRDQLSLLAVGSQQPQPLLVGSARVAGARPVEIQLAQGWGLERRSYEGQRLSHLYVANPNPLPVLMAQARAGGSDLLAVAPLPPPPPRPDAERRQRSSILNSAAETPPRLQSLPVYSTGGPQSWGNAVPDSQRQLVQSPRQPRTPTPRAAAYSTDAGTPSGGVIALQVVPFQP